MTDSAVTLYTTGANRIIAGGMVLSTPIVKAGQIAILQIRDLLLLNLQNSPKVPVYDISILFSEFYTSFDLAVGIIFKLLASFILKNTLRPEIGAKTIITLANEIRSESFKKFDDVLGLYVSTMQNLGINLESRSAIGAAVNGALTGGGLQFLVTGNSGKSGAIVGALISAAIENSQKEQLRQGLVQTAIAGMNDLIIIIPQLSEALMDQYTTLIFGSEVDFKQRDSEIARTQTELATIAKNTESLLHNITAYAKTAKNIETTLKKKTFAGRNIFKDWRFRGSWSYPAYWKGFFKNPFKAFFDDLFDPYGVRFKVRKELQKQVVPELNSYKKNIEITLLDMSNLEQAMKSKLM